MPETSATREKQAELLSVIAGLERGANQAVLLERAKQAALSTAVALLEQDADLIESLFPVVREKIQRVKNWKAHRSTQLLR